MSVLEGITTPKLSYEAAVLSEGSKMLVLEGITMPKLSYEASFDGYVPSAASYARAMEDTRIRSPNIGAAHTLTSNLPLDALGPGNAA